MAARSVLKALAEYNCARLKFCEIIANEANSNEAVIFMESQGILELLIPLVGDIQLNVRCNVLNCLSRMANCSHRIADLLIERNIPQVMFTLVSPYRISLRTFSSDHPQSICAKPKQQRVL